MLICITFDKQIPDQVYTGFEGPDITYNLRVIICPRKIK